VGSAVLVIDDDAAFRGLAKRILAAQGLRVCAEAGTARGAMNVALELRPGAALVDVGLPDGDGVELARELAALPWSPRVLLTSSDGDACASEEVLAFVPKEQLPGVPLRSFLCAD
jgi:DNA-binding NarL/FixJ family response regulator